ncbi:hypothetical protein ACFQE5_04945 [Pseudonocardia hispaniensis]|uniref:Transmembrane protein n=1 Tax=Pseudonocardia hispaniensis TaxID=904933 RepID=A0ABW1IZ34_9PSEU
MCADSERQRPERPDTPGAVRWSYRLWMLAVCLGFVLPGLVLLIVYLWWRSGFTLPLGDNSPSSLLGLVAVVLVMLIFLGSIRHYARRMSAGERHGRVRVAVVGGIWGLLMLVVGFYNAFGDAPFGSVRIWGLLALAQVAAIVLACALMFSPHANVYFGRSPHRPGPGGGPVRHRGG